MADPTWVSGGVYAMGCLPGTPYPFVTPFGLTPQGPWPPVYLGQTAPIAAAAANLGTIALPGAFNTLYIDITITGFSGSDFAAIRFNGDSGANYVSRYITAVAGGVVFVDQPFASATAMRLTPINQTTGSHISLRVNNFLSVSKQASVVPILTTGAAATAATLVIPGAGEWVNTTAQITSVLVLVGGANNFNAGSSVTIWGSN